MKPSKPKINHSPGKYDSESLQQGQGQPYSIGRLIFRKVSSNLKRMPNPGTLQSMLDPNEQVLTQPDKFKKYVKQIKESAVSILKTLRLHESKSSAPGPKTGKSVTPSSSDSSDAGEGSSRSSLEDESSSSGESNQEASKQLGEDLLQENPGPKNETVGLKKLLPGDRSRFSTEQKFDSTGKRNFDLLYQMKKVQTSLNTQINDSSYSIVQIINKLKENIFNLIKIDPKDATKKGQKIPDEDELDHFLTVQTAAVMEMDDLKQRVDNHFDHIEQKINSEFKRLDGLKGWVEEAIQKLNSNFEKVVEKQLLLTTIVKEEIEERCKGLPKADQKGVREGLKQFNDKLIDLEESLDYFVEKKEFPYNILQGVVSQTDKGCMTMSLDMLAPLCPIVIFKNHLKFSVKFLEGRKMSSNLIRGNPTFTCFKDRLNYLGLQYGNGFVVKNAGLGARFSPLSDSKKI